MQFGTHHDGFVLTDQFKRKNLIYSFIIFTFTLAVVGLTIFSLKDYKISINSKATEGIKNPLSKNFITADQSDIKELHKLQVIGFLPSWTLAQDYDVKTEYLDQIIYFGLGVNEGGEIIKHDDEGKEVLEWHYLNSEKFKEIQKSTKKTNTKLVIAVKNFDNATIDGIISSQSKSNYLIRQIITLLNDYDFDGVNIDFEYFTDVDFPTSQFLNKFLSQLKDELKKNNKNLILSIDVNSTAIYTDKAYDMVKIGEIVDQIIVMGYDYTRAPSKIAGSSSPINAQNDDPSLTKSVESLTGRVQDEKIVLAIPLYGFEWQTYSKNHGSYTVPDSGAIATYKRVKELLNSKLELEIFFDDVSQTPWLIYLQNGAIKQIYYENDQSLRAKADFTSKAKLGGIAVWSMGYEGTHLEPWSIFQKYRSSSK